MRPFHASLVQHAWFVAFCMLCSYSFAAEKPSKPDVLVIMPDQMRGDCLSILGHAAVRTPHLDELAQQGALFRRAYTTVPSCIPARHALLSGLFPQTSGVVGFRGRALSCPTMPEMLRDAGYTTVLVGRHMHQVPHKEPYGYQQQILGSTYIADDDYDAYLKKVAPDSGGIRKLVADVGVSYNGWEAKPWPLPDDRHPTAWIARQARRIVADTACPSQKTHPRGTRRTDERGQSERDAWKTSTATGRMDCGNAISIR